MRIRLYLRLAKGAYSAGTVAVIAIFSFALLIAAALWCIFTVFFVIGIYAAWID